MHFTPPVVHSESIRCLANLLLINECIGKQLHIYIHIYIMYNICNLLDYCLTLIELESIGPGRDIRCYSVHFADKST